MAWRCAVGLLALLLSSCTHNNSNPKNIPILSVNGHVYTAVEFGSALAKSLKVYDALAAKDPVNIERARESVIQEFVISALLEQYAAAHDIQVSDSELLDEFDHIRKTYPDDLTFKAALATGGQTLEEWKGALKRTLLERKVFSSLAPLGNQGVESEARQLYETHKGDYVRPPQIHLQQIVVTREDDAERIFHKLKSGASFASLAQKFSISPDGAQGGDVGWVGRGTMPAFDSAFNLSVGKTSPIVKSSYGFHIMRVLDKRPAGHLTFEQVKPRLIRQVNAKKQQAAFNQWLEAGIKSAKIERNDTLLERIKIRTEGEGE
jgi:peptidyl-prolyl cis-trans isomerase C